MKAVKDLASKAVAVGVPVTAIYLSGSVVGLSAAGITSGLAVLGLGGILGLSAMVTGIGVAIIAGAAAYKGVQWLLGVSNRSKASRRELMLQEVLQIHQRAIVNLGEDIAYFAERLKGLVIQVEANAARIDVLYKHITILSKSSAALTRLGERADRYERDLEEEIVGNTPT